eukprot:Gregarina_sp_Poly_1__3441@NODE_19_length_21533_cov_161_091167_g17_i0_p3_GENE_NODE_19_length_21533_cov_161_091167_g17_i0NODE_19_length_21533_cov_161_091167_g17_i0_p3_ORF_typecomplete_len636_score103_01UNC80/PF15778_5/0_16SRA1/PF07304_11/5_9e03SRA1/PF07304_11/11_NODE_19_length_21533_cov_161_091167_g17_i01505016957
MSTSRIPLFPPPPSDSEIADTWSPEFSKCLSFGVGSAFPYLRSDSTAASSGGDANFPLAADELGLAAGGAEESFVSTDPPSGSAPCSSCNQTSSSYEKSGSMEVFGTPPIIKTLLDDVDWSLNKEDDYMLRSAVAEETSAAVDEPPGLLDNVGHQYGNMLPSSITGLQFLHNLLKQQQSRETNSSENPSLPQDLDRLLNEADSGGNVRKLIDLALVCHWTGQLLSTNSGVNDAPSALKQPSNEPPHAQAPSAGVNRESSRSAHGSIYVFPPPPPSAFASAVDLAPSPHISTNIEQIFQSLNSSLNEFLSQLMAPAMNGFFQQSLPSVSRWRNIDVTFPVLLPTGSICISNDSDIQKMEATYSFDNPDLQSVFGPPVLDLFSSGDFTQGGITPASMLRTRVAVIHKCPDFLVPKMSQLFHELINSQCPMLDEPITLSCTRVSRCSVPLCRQSGLGQGDRGDCQERIEALVSPASIQDERRLLKVSSLLWSLADTINTRLTQVLSAFYSRIPQSLLQRRSVPEDLFNVGTRKVGLEFRFAPSKQMKIVLAQRSLHQPSSLLVKRVDVTGIQLCEIRLEQDRRLDKEWDPLLLERSSVYVPTKRILRDDSGGCMGRALLVANEKINLPRVCQMMNQNC